MADFDDDVPSLGEKKKLSSQQIAYISAIVVLAVIVIVTVPTLSVILIQNANAKIPSGSIGTFGKTKRKPISASYSVPHSSSTFSMIIPKAPLFKASLPYTINANERLIVKVIRSATYFTDYFIYRYPTGTYVDLQSLVNALNTVNNSDAIYFDANNFTWFINKSLYWSISGAGKLQVTWQDAFYDQVVFFSSPPLQDPKFVFSNGQGGIDDTTVQPDTTTLVTDFGIPIGPVFQKGIPIPLPFG